MRITGTLEDKCIEHCVSEAEAALEKAGGSKDDRVRLRLSMEEILIAFRDNVGTGIPVQLRVRRKIGNLKVILSIKGEEYDPFRLSDSLILIKALHDWSGAPDRIYRDGINIFTYSFTIRKSLADNLGFAWKYTSPHKRYLFMAVFMQLVSVALMIIAPILSAGIIVAYTNSAFRRLLYTALALFAINLLSHVVLTVCNWAYNVVYNRTLTALEAEIADSVLKITNRCIDENGTGLFIQRLTTDTSNLATAFNTLADNISQICQYIGILCAMLIVSPLIFGLTVVIFSVRILMELRREKISKQNGRLFRNANERYTTTVGEMVRGAKDIKLGHAEDTFRKELDIRIREANDARMFWYLKNLKYKLAGGFASEGGFLVFAVTLAFLLETGTFSVATTLILFNYYSNLGTPAITLMGTLLDFITEFNLSCERLSDINNDAVFPKEQYGIRAQDKIRGEICFRNVRFSYNIHKLNTSVRWVLFDMNFTINAGETVALVGRSGSGKTTIFNLISKLYETFSGTVMIDGIDIREFDRDTLRGCMSVVTQSPYIFGMSIRDNLKMVKPDMTEEEMHRAASLACIDEDIAAMPDKYDTVIGEGGVNLSGGQKQRLAIARSLLRECSILLLDEATSALDNVTQAKIKRALMNIHGTSTIVMIAHRLSTVVDADRILYIEDGRVLAQGKHDELVASCEEYRTLYDTEEQVR